MQSFRSKTVLQSVFTDCIIIPGIKNKSTPKGDLNMKLRYLFQGDSITDAGRDRTDGSSLGTGYPYFAADLFRDKYPEIDFEFLNRGIGGDKTPDLIKRWQTDCIDLEPDIVSIMVGINDAAFCVPDEEYERLYDDLLSQVRQKTKAKIIMLEAFLLVTPGREKLRSPLDAKLVIQRRVARRYADIYVPVDGPLFAASLHDDLTKWAFDGVHPSEICARLIAKQLVDYSEPLFDELLHRS